MRSPTLFLCLLSLLQYAIVIESKTSPWDPFHTDYQGILELPQLPFDPNVIQNAKCKEDMFFWINAVQDFVSGITAVCNNTDMSCLETKEASLTNNMFAAKQLDSFGRIPVNLLNFNMVWQGSWEECMEVATSTRKDYKTQFCWAYMITPITNMATGTSASTELCARLAASMLLTRWSVCMPRSCKNEDVTALLRTVDSYAQGELAFCSTDCRPSTPPTKNGAFWVVTMYMAVAVLLMIIGSAVDYATDCDHERCKAFRKNTLVKCVMAFSMYTNGDEILTVKKRPGQIECLHCIRVVSMTWVMAGHAFMVFMNGDNLMQMLKINKYFLNIAFTNGFFSVDSFLFLGGLLLTFLFIKEMDKSPQKIRSPTYWILYYVHRIVRLSIPYYLYIGFAVAYYEYMEQGPAIAETFINAAVCKRYWWKNVLYISNLWDVQDACLGHTWYLSIDMQIHVFAPILLVPLFFSPIAGTIVAYLLIVLSSCICYWAYYKHDSPASFAGGFAGNTPGLDLSTTQNFQQYLYFAPWIRYTPYVIGALTGYVLAKMKGKKPHLNPLLVIGLWITAAALGIGSVYSLYDYYNGEYLSKFERATYYNFSRISWSFALAWVVMACEHNWAGPIKKLMEMDFWAPVSRLTYCAYLCHFLFVSMLGAMERTPPHWVGVTQMYVLSCLPLFCVSYVFAFLWSCAFELPSMKLERMAVAALMGVTPRGGDRLVERRDDGKTLLVAEVKVPASTSNNSSSATTTEPSNNGHPRQDNTTGGDSSSGMRWRAPAVPAAGKPSTYDYISEQPERQTARL